MLSTRTKVSHYVYNLVAMVTVITAHINVEGGSLPRYKAAYI